MFAFLSNLGVPQAQAGEWKVSYRMSGTGEGIIGGGTSWKDSRNGDTLVNAADNADGDVNVLAFSDTKLTTLQQNNPKQYQRAEGQAVLDGQFTVIFTWTKEAGETVLPPVPGQISFAVSSNSNVQVDNGPEVNAILRTGFDFEVEETKWSVPPPLGENHHDITVKPNQKRLVQLATDGQNQVTWDAPQFYGKAWSKGRTFSEGDYVTNQHGEVTAQLKAVLDDRTVSLSRVDAHDEWPEGSVTHGDTTYSYDVQNPENTRTQVNVQHFSVVFGGQWTERELDSFGVQWTEKGTSNEWSPASDVDKFQDYWTSASYNMPFGDLDFWTFGALKGWDGSFKSKSEKQITYTVKDNRNNEGEITAELKYVLHIHDPIEIFNDTSYLDSVTVTVFQDDDKPIVRSHIPEGQNPATSTYGTGSSSGWSATWSLGDEILPFFKPLGIDLAYESSSEEYYEVSIEDPIVSEGKYRYLQAKHHYNRHTADFWAYDTGGKRKRMVDAIGDGHYQPAPGEKQEVPHELFYDVFLGDQSRQAFWSEEVNEKVGAPERDPNAPNDSPAQPNPTLPEPSSKYS